MTFAEFLKYSSHRAKLHLNSEDRRMCKARKEWDRYTMRMGALGLHPLTRVEI